MDAFNKMFSFIWSQPIHVTLRQMRIVPVGLIISSQLLLWEIVRSLKALDATQAAMAFGAIAAALIAAIWKGVDSLHRSNIKDDN
jgi:hypothetical protein